MSGYLWLCECCDGGGRMMQLVDDAAQTITYAKLPLPNGWVFFHFPGKSYGNFVNCPECSGRGYWEP